MGYETIDVKYAESFLFRACCLCFFLWKVVKARAVVVDLPPACICITAKGCFLLIIFLETSSTDLAVYVPSCSSPALLAASFFAPARVTDLLALLLFLLFLLQPLQHFITSQGLPNDELAGFLSCIQEFFVSCVGFRVSTKHFCSSVRRGACLLLKHSAGLQWQGWSKFPGGYTSARAYTERINACFLEVTYQMLCLNHNCETRRANSFWWC